MKVVLFCGGLGTRLREASDTVPKPLVEIGYRPVVWHLMRYYAHFGHTEFVLALGYRGEMLREYFLNYSEVMTNDFTLSEGGSKVELHSRDFADWKITFVDTGLHSNIGQRLLRVRPYLEDEPMFLANYSDGLSAHPLDEQIEAFRARDAVVSLAAVHSGQSVHAVRVSDDDRVSSIGSLSSEPLVINGGFFVMRQSVFDYIEEGEELVEQPFARLMRDGKLLAYRWGGFFKSMDTFKDKIEFDRAEARGNSPWKVWNGRRAPG